MPGEIVQFFNEPLRSSPVLRNAAPKIKTKPNKINGYRGNIFIARLRRLLDCKILEGQHYFVKKATITSLNLIHLAIAAIVQFYSLFFVSPGRDYILVDNKFRC